VSRIAIVRAKILAASACVALIVHLGACGKKREDKDRPATAGDAGAVASADGGVDRKAVAAQFDKACLGGDHEACRNLGVLYTEGVGVAPDLRRAAALFAQACNGGNLAGCNHAALALAEGMGVAKDPAKAAELYVKACDGGYPLACRNGGLMLRDGRGVAQDLARAEAMLRKACDGGAPYACTNAGDLDRQLAATEGAPRFKKMIAHYQQGCDAGDPTACRAIGVAYLEGTGLPKSPSAATVWLGRACDKDEPVACRVLGALALQGVGMKQDVTRGRSLLQRACDRKDDEACRVIAKLDGGSNAGSIAVPQDAGRAAPGPARPSSAGMNPGSGQRE